MWPSYHIEQLHAPFRPRLHVHFRKITENDISLCVSTDEFDFYIRFPNDIHCKSGDNNWKKEEKRCHVPMVRAVSVLFRISRTKCMKISRASFLSFFFLFLSIILVSVPLELFSSSFFCSLQVSDNRNVGNIVIQSTTESNKCSHLSINEDRQIGMREKTTAQSFQMDNVA